MPGKNPEKLGLDEDLEITGESKCPRFTGGETEAQKHTAGRTGAVQKGSEVQEASGPLLRAAAGEVCQGARPGAAGRTPAPSLRRHGLGKSVHLSATWLPLLRNRARAPHSLACGEGRLGDAGAPMGRLPWRFGSAPPLFPLWATDEATAAFPQTGGTQMLEGTEARTGEVEGLRGDLGRPREVAPQQPWPQLC